MAALNTYELRRHASRLIDLEPWKRVAFVAALASRMIPNFLSFHKETNFGDPAVLGNALTACWNWVATPDADLPDGLSSECDLQAPNTEDHRSAFTSAALDAANVVSITVELIFCPRQELVLEAVTLAFDTIDIYLQLTGNLDPSSPLLDEYIASSYLMKREMRRQLDDIAELTSSESRKAVAERWRIRAQTQPQWGSLDADTGSLRFSA